MKHLVGLIVAVIWIFPALGQMGPGGEAKAISWELGAHLGNLLPSQIPGVTEITPLWGLRIGLPQKQGATWEVGAMTGRADGAEWHNASISARMEHPIEQLLGIFMIGGDITHYRGSGRSQGTTAGGGHFGGGIMAMISDSLWFRGDMKFNVNPGTSLYFGFGFALRFPQGESSGDEGAK